MASESKDENPEHINLKVIVYSFIFSYIVEVQVMGQDGNAVQFKIKRHTALKKLMSTYCERAGLALQVVLTFPWYFKQIEFVDNPILFRWNPDKRERHP